MKTLAIIIIIILIVLLILWFLRRRSVSGNYSGMHLNEEHAAGKSEETEETASDISEMFLKGKGKAAAQVKDEEAKTEEPESLLYLFQDEPEKKEPEEPGLITQRQEESDGDIIEDKAEEQNEYLSSESEEGSLIDTVEEPAEVFSAETSELTNEYIQEQVTEEQETDPSEDSAGEYEESENNTEALNSAEEHTEYFETDSCDNTIERSVPETAEKRKRLPNIKAIEPRASGLNSTGSFSRIIAVNFETPNNEHDSVCNIGITIGDKDNRISTNITVDPEVEIEDVPDGLTKEEIHNSPTFGELWPELSKLFSGALVIAHNSSYDLTILKKILKSYDLQAPEFYQACTYRMSRKFHPEFDNYKLSSICEIYDIPLDVRNAVSHSDACFDIFCRLADEGNDVFAEAKPFQL